MNIIKFEKNEDIFEYNYQNNYCIVLEDVIIDNSYITECTPIFWHNGKRLQKLIDRVHGDWTSDADLYWLEKLYPDRISKFPSNLNIDNYEDNLFLLFDVFNNNVGHFLLENFTRAWYFDNYNWGSDTKIATVQMHNQENGMPSLNQLLHLKYKNNHRELEFGKVHHIKRLIIPGFYYMIGDANIPKRVYDFIDNISENVIDLSFKNKIYISRQDIVNKTENKNNHWHNRILKNEIELIDLLKNKEYDVFQMMQVKSGEEIVNIFKNKEIITILMGAAAHLTIFCSPNTTVNLILNPRMQWVKTWFDNLKMYKNLKINYIIPNCEFFDNEANEYILDKDKINVPWKILNLEEILKLL